MTLPPFETGVVPFRSDVGYRVVLPAGRPPAAGFPYLLALHGFGDDGARLGARLGGCAPARCALVLPDGPYPVEMRAEAPPRVGRAWYQYTGDGAEFVRAMVRTGAWLEELAAAVAERHALDPRRRVLLGYSQGGYLAGYHALAHAGAWRGLIVIAARIKHEALAEELPAAAGFPVLALHGARDASVGREAVERSIAALRAAGAAVDFRVHDGGHGLRAELVPAIRDFAADVLGTAAT